MTSTSPHLRVAVAGAFATIVAIAVAQRPAPTAQAPTPEDVCNITTTERVVVVGDVHGAYKQFVSILQTAGILKGDRWAGGRTIFIQTGDILDRGPDSKRVIDLLRRMEGDATRQGGRVYALLGNHEFMRLVGDWRYVSPGELKAFTNGDSEAWRDQVYAKALEQAAKRAASEKRAFDPADYRKAFLKEVPLGFLEMRRAFDVKEDYGRWVRQRNTVVKVNGILFLHGGISEKNAALGCAGLNAAVREDMAAIPKTPLEKIASLLSSTEDGPLWYRGLANEPEDTFAPTLNQILKTMDARGVVIGHTPLVTVAAKPPRITPRFGGRVIMIDTGMLNRKSVV